MTVLPNSLSPSGLLKRHAGGLGSRVSRFAFSVAALTLAFSGLPSVSAAPAAAPATAPAYAFADSAFDLIWTRTDAGVASNAVTRSWVWGPEPGVYGIEPYAEAPDGSGVRLVQYFDKARMEVNDPKGDPKSQWFVTNGLLTVELMTGRLQTGNDAFQQREPADIPIGSDTDDTTAPTYASFLKVSNTPLGEHRQPDRKGQVVTDIIDKAGDTWTDASKSRYGGLRVSYYEPTTGHNIPEIFYTYLNSSGQVYMDGKTSSKKMFDPWIFTMGLPISDAYWTTAKIGGKQTEVLIQAFERRVLTYVPSAEKQWQVQMGNIGQHYYQWRYGGTWYDGQAGPKAVAAVAPSKPMQLVIPKIGVRANIESLGQDAKGNFDVPKDPWNVGWYKPGFVPGTPGNSAIDGHLDAAGIGPVVFWRLSDMKAGDRYYVRDDKGRDRAFVAVETEACPFDDCPLQKVFGPTTATRLNLITCEGTFDRSTRNYDQRYVVYGEMVK